MEKGNKKECQTILTSSVCPLETGISAVTYPVEKALEQMWQGIKRQT